MDSSDEVDNKSIDPKVGGLVWVRRRNGSWWPGRIMGLDELPEECLVGATTGTPIKLLGRDDASVDWYNLDRSKRVKPFRCEEYNGCIEKAKAAANANKKVAKYARREDAILHALELENARQIDDEPDFCSRTDISGNEQDGISCKNLPTTFHSADDGDDYDEVSDSEETSTSAQDLSQSGISFEEPKHINVPKVPSVQGSRRTPDDSEDDETKGIKRMRGLEDLGLSEMSKRKARVVGIYEEVEQDTALIYNSKMPSSKRKRSQFAYVHEFLKRKNRRRTLAKILESTDLVNVPIMCHESYLCGVSNNLSVLESNETTRNVSGVINNSSDSTCASFEHGSDVLYSQNKLKENGNSSMLGSFDNDFPDRLFDVPLVEEGKHATVLAHTFSSSTGKLIYSSPIRQSGHELQLEAALPTNGGFFKAEAAFDGISQRIEKSSSKWQSKGKRKSRHTSKKSTKHELENSMDLDKILFDSSQTHQRSLPYRQSRLSVQLKYQTDEPELFLYDVIVEVKANYRPQHVPLVSLMSKLNGKAIIGHPLTVEVIEEGASDQFAKMHVVPNGQLGFTEKSRNKPPKPRKGSLLLKKTRKLSSLACCQKLSENRKTVVETLNAPAIACVPLNVVFSRLNAAVSGSARSSHRAVT